MTNPHILRDKSVTNCRHLGFIAEDPSSVQRIKTDRNLCGNTSGKENQQGGKRRETKQGETSMEETQPMSRNQWDDSEFRGGVQVSAGRIEEI